MRRVQFVTISTVAVVVLFMTSSVDCVDCRKYVFAPACRGVWAKRSSADALENNDYGLKSSEPIGDLSSEAETADTDEMLEKYEGRMKQKQNQRLHAIRLITQLQKLHRQRNLPLSTLLQRINKAQSQPSVF